MYQKFGSLSVCPSCTSSPSFIGHTPSPPALTYYPFVISGINVACDVSSNSSELQDHSESSCVWRHVFANCQSSGDSGAPACKRHTRAVHKGAFILSPRVYFPILLLFTCLQWILRDGEGWLHGLLSVCQERVEPVVCFMSSLVTAIAYILWKIFYHGNYI